MPSQLHARLDWTNLVAAFSPCTECENAEWLIIHSYYRHSSACTRSFIPTQSPALLSQLHICSIHKYAFRLGYARKWGWIHVYVLASFPSLHAQLLSLAVQKAGEGLDGFITWCMPQLMSCSVCSCMGLFSLLHSSFPKFSSFFLFSLSCESDCYCIDRG